MLRGSLYTPELLVASNLSPAEIEFVFDKFEQGHRKQIPQKYIYVNDKLADMLRPHVVRDEL